MLVSFLVPVYNVEKYIDQCMKTLLMQTGCDYEIVLLDDGSKDSSGVICDQYAAKYPDLVRVVHKQNEGLFMTRRRGFKEAKGDYLVCVDSDDYIKPNYLETIVKYIQEYDCDMLMFDYESFYPDGHTELSGIDLKNIFVYENEQKQNIYKKRLLENKYNNIWSKVIRRDIMDFETDYSVYGIKNMCEDAIQSYELYTRAKKIVFIPEVLYCYRRNIASITANVNMDYWYALRTSYELGWKYMDLWKVNDEVRQRYASRCISYYVDFIHWLLVRSNKAEIDQIVNETMLENKYFNESVRLYKKEYLATKYLRFRNPIIIHMIMHKSYKSIKRFYQLETKIRKGK